ncbi:unnamed protein product [Adineta ricciae]|uniref:Uncharacterized protein n=1 Tax=Adineta ricciae TaxID=249248 RepID=A0A815HEC3_ADIRI|nr:unnamed protein product [Adineta ricciae]
MLCLGIYGGGFPLPSAGLEWFSPFGEFASQANELHLPRLRLMKLGVLVPIRAPPHPAGKKAGSCPGLLI